MVGRFLPSSIQLKKQPIAARKEIILANEEASYIFFGY